MTSVMERAALKLPFSFIFNKKKKKKLGNEKVELFFIVLQQHKDVHETLQRACNHIWIQLPTAILDAA